MQSRIWLLAALPLLFVAPASAQTAHDEAVQRLKQDPNSVTAIREFMRVKLGAIQQVMRADPEAANTILVEMSAILSELKLDNKEAQDELKKAHGFLDVVQRRIKLTDTTVDKLADRLRRQPDAKLVMQYLDKVLQTEAENSRRELDKSKALVTEALELLKSLEDQAKDKPDFRESLQRAQQNLADVERRLQSRIEHEARLAKLIGQDPAPLQADAWVNGQPLAKPDLQGKVVLLNFWTVWCRPCLRTYPYLHQWQEKYKDQGLVIVAITNYARQYSWDAQSQQLVAAKEEVTSQDERSMLASFAQAHDFNYVMAVQKSRTLIDYYAVEQIPQFVLIDRQGKVRQARVGADAETLGEVADMLEQLIKEGQQPEPERTSDARSIGSSGEP